LAFIFLSCARWTKKFAKNKKAKTRGQKRERNRTNHRARALF